MKRNFAQTIIVGVGLLGGSVGLAARRAAVGGKIIGLGRNEAKLRLAVEKGAIDDFATDWSAALAFGAELSPDETTQIIFAAPVVANLRALDDCAAAIAANGAGRRFLISDVGSVKGNFARRAAAVAAETPNVVAVPVHPIAGSDRSGVEFADAELFRERLTIITPWTSADERRAALSSGDAEPFDDYAELTPKGAVVKTALVEKISRLVGGEKAAAVAAVRDFWRPFGCRIVETSADEHDRVLANASHFPNLISVLATSVVPEEDFPFSGTGFRDVSRLAGGSPEVWTEIFGENRVATLEALERLEKNVALWKTLLQNDDRAGIAAFLTETKRKKESLRDLRRGN